MQQESPLLSNQEGTNGNDLKNICNEDHQCQRAVGDGRHVSRVILCPRLQYQGVTEEQYECELLQISHNTKKSDDRVF